MEALSREKILLPVTSPVHKDLQPGSVPAHREWAATLLSVWVQAYNTNVVKKDEPAEDLPGPPRSEVEGQARHRGEERRLVRHRRGRHRWGRDRSRASSATSWRPTASPSAQGHTLLNNMVVSGEVPLALTVYNYMPEQAKKKGAPIDWFALEPAIARSNAVGVARHAPHPERGAALLRVPARPKAQQRFVSIDYVPTNTKVASPLKGVKIVQADPRALPRRIGALDEALRRYPSGTEGTPELKRHRSTKRATERRFQVSVPL